MNSDHFKRKADAAWGAAIHAAGRCAMCGAGGGLEAHHIISRARKATRHAVENGMLLCVRHHIEAHKNKRAFWDWLRDNRPDQWRWVTANKWNTGKPDYAKSYRRLTGEKTTTD